MRIDFDIDIAAKACVDELLYHHVIGENLLWDHSEKWYEVAAKTIAKYMHRVGKQP